MVTRSCGYASLLLVVATMVATTMTAANANANAGGSWADLSPLQPSPTASSVETFANTSLHGTITQVIAQQCKVVRKAIMANVEGAANGPLVRRILEKNVDAYETYAETLSPIEQNKLFLEIGETPEQQRRTDESAKDRRARRRHLMLTRYDSAMTETGHGISALAGGNDYTRLLSQALLALFGQHTYTACDALTATIRNAEPISDATITNATLYSYLTALSTPTSAEFIKREPGYIAALFNAGAFEEYRSLADDLVHDMEADHPEDATAHGRVPPSMHNHPYFGPALSHRIPFNPDFTAELDASFAAPLKKLVLLSRTLSKIVLSQTVTHTLAIIREHFLEHVYGFNPLQFTRVGVFTAEKAKVKTVLEAIKELRDESREGFDGGDESGGAIQGRFRDEDLWYGIQRRKQLLGIRVRTYLTDLESFTDEEAQKKAIADMSEEELQGNYHQGELFGHEEIDNVDGESIMAYAQPSPGEQALDKVPHADEIFDATVYKFKGPTYAADAKFLEESKEFSVAHASILPPNDIHRLLDVEDALYLYNPDEVLRQRVALSEGRKVVDKRFTSLEYIKHLISSRVATTVDENDGNAPRKSALMQFLSNLATEVSLEATRQQKRVELSLDTSTAASTTNVEAALLSGIPVPRSLFDVVAATHSAEQPSYNGTSILAHPQDAYWMQDLQFLLVRSTMLRELQPITTKGAAGKTPVSTNDHDEL